jgi:hypothetical protein
MNHHLLPHHREEFDYWFTPPPYTWQAVRSAEIMRWWRVVRESETEVLLTHPTGACARLDLADGVVVGVELIEGERSRALLETG